MFLCLGVGTALLTQSGAADRSNLIVIMADDLGLGDLGCYNAESKIPTPHCDRFASEGMRFADDAHSPSAVCTPTRYGLLTGRYCWRTRYFYRVRIETPPGNYPHEVFAFSGASVEHTPVAFRMAFGGGAGYVPENERMWTTIGSMEPDALLLLGDNIYSDAPESPAMQHYCYFPTMRSSRSVWSISIPAWSIRP